MNWREGIPTERECHYLVEHKQPGYGRYSVRWVSENERCDLYDWANLRWLVIEDAPDFTQERGEDALEALREWVRDGEPYPAFTEWRAAEVLEHVNALEHANASVVAALKIKEETIARLRRDRDECHNLIEFLKPSAETDR